MGPHSLQMVTVVRAAGRYVCHSLLTQSCVSFLLFSLSLTTSPSLRDFTAATHHPSCGCVWWWTRVLSVASTAPRTAAAPRSSFSLLPSPPLCVEAAGHSPFPPSWLTEAAGAQSQTREENTARSICRESPFPPFV